MRTKVEKNHKKIAEEKLMLNLPSPKVVLNADECARLLDGAGKTSVLLVEKGGKMVPAASVAPLSTTASAVVSVSPSLSGSNESSLNTGNQKSSPDGAKGSAETDRIVDTEVTEKREGSSCTIKAILKPPKKRRGLDKKFETSDKSGEVFNNGDLSHHSSQEVVDGVGHESVDGHCSKLELPQKAESSQKHSVENLLNYPSSSSSSSTSANNMLLSNFSHPASFDSRTHLLQQTVSAAPLPTSITSSSLSPLLPMPQPESYQSINPYHLALAQTPCQLFSHSSFTASAHNQNHMALPYSVSSGQTPQTVVYNASQTPQAYLNKQVSPTSPSKSLSLLAATGGGNTVTLSPTFQHLPEQVEPMNLSKSCKPAVSVVTLQSDGLLNPSESRMAEDVPVNLASQHSPLQGITGSQDPNTFISEPLLPRKTDFKKQKNKISKTIKASASQSKVTLLPSVADNKNLDNLNNRLHKITEDVIVASSLRTDTVSDIDSVIATSEIPCQQAELAECLSVKCHSSELPVSDQLVVKEVQIESHLNNAEILVPPQISLDSAGASVSPTPDKPSLLACETLSTAANHPLNNETESTKKSKRSKKKPEIPMDEESCASRKAKYTESIDYVISNFVFIPDPVEDFNLTEEEESVLRDQFEETKTVNIDSTTDSSKAVEEPAVVVTCNQAHCQTQTDLSDSESESMPRPITPLKKRQNMVTKVVLSRTKQERQVTADHIDSILSFVAADVFNSTPPMESGLGDELIRQQKLLLMKQELLQSSDMAQNNNTHSNDNNKRPSGEDCVDKIRQTNKNSADSTQTIEKDGEFDENRLSAIACISDKILPKNADEMINQGKTKKISKKLDKPELSTTVGEAHPTEPLVTMSVNDCEASVKKRKKTAEGKSKAPQKSKENLNLYHPAAVPFNVDVITVADKEILSTNRVETSDIGESIASTSGGSEQDTPTHEPETKDDPVSSDPNLAEKESQDTGLESGGEDNQPVKKYKKRLDFVKCAHCDHQARGRSALSRHMKKVHLMDANMPYKCNKCDYGCSKMASLNRHLFTHGVFPCSRCTFVADERIKLGQHVMEQHKDKLDMKLCKVCNRYIKCDLVTIEAHTEACQGPTPFKCSECEKEFKYASSLRVHYHTHFPDQPKRFKCEQCEYRTNYKANLHKHQKNMHAAKDRDVRCPDCDKLFSTEDNMRRHRKVHTLNRPFACEICKKTFKTSGALKGHHLIHTATRPFSCNIPGCNRSFRTPKFLKSHQEEFHRLVPKKFFCNVDGCNYSFFKRSHLKRHAITHTGERNYHCSWPGCSKSFRHADNLKVHFRSHTNEKPVQCHLCDFKCKQKNSLFWHKKKVHHIIDATVCPRRWERKFKAETSDSGQELEEGLLDSPKLECPEAIVDHPIDSSTKDNTCSDRTSSPAVSDSCVKSDSAAEVKEKATIQKPLEEESQDEDQPVVNNTLQPQLDKTSSKDQTISTQTPIARDNGPKDLYEFNSDNDSEEEVSPGNFRRDKIPKAVLTPLPPPPKELLRKNEILEIKEKEKKDKAEKRELEKKEKAEKREQEKKEKAEKRGLEKKEKAEKRELEKKEKAEKKELEKKEKIEKKELEKKEKVEKKLQEKREMAEKKEQERKERELERKENEEKKICEKKDGKKKKEKASGEIVVKEKMEIKEVKKVKKVIEKKPVAGKRKRSSAVNKDDAKEIHEEPLPVRSTRKRRGQNTESAKVDDINKEEMTPSPNKKKRLPPGKQGESSTPPKSVTPQKVPPKKASAVKAPAAGQGRRKGRFGNRKRKSSARLRARRKAMEKTKTITKVNKQQKVVPKKKSLRQRSTIKEDVKEEEEVEEVTEKDDKNEKLAEIDTAVEEQMEEQEALPCRRSQEIKKEETKDDSEEHLVTNRPLSPAYSEELMLQGKASPYREYSDADNVDEEEKCAGEQLSRQEPKSPHELLTEDKDTDKSLEDEASTGPNTERSEEDSDPADDDSSDDEVSNDIPLTPPRAPAPPPMESSEDEMEPEPTVTPFSVPGPTTPFSVPGPNTPFSVPPPTNLIQQHSVHSEEAPMSVLPSVPSMEVHSQGSVEMQQSLGSVEMNHPHSVEMSHPHGSVEMHHPHGSVEMHHPHGSVEMHHPHGSDEMYRPHGSVEMHHPHGSVEMHHPHGSVEMQHPHGSVEMHHPHGSVEMHHPHGSVEMQHPHGSVEMHHPHGSVEMHHTHSSMEMHSHSTSNEIHSHNSSDMRPNSSIPEQPMSHIEHRLGSVKTPESIARGEIKYDLPPLHGQSQTMEADKEYFDQYLKSLSAANNRAANGGLELPTSGLRELEAMVGKSHQDLREMSSKSPISSLPSSVITSLENTLPILGSGDLRVRMDVFDRHHESLYVRDTPSSLPRLTDRQSATPLAPAPAFDAFSSLNSLHPAATAAGARENSYLRQPDNLFPTPPVATNFMAEAMFQRQAMSTPFLPPQPSDRSSLSRIPDSTQLRSTSSSLLRRTGTMPGSDMFTTPAMPQTMPKNPFTNSWASQDTRPTHWQTPYLPRQPNMTTPSSFFPSKDNYLTGREFMFDPSVRQSAERGMFPSLSTSQTQDTFFDFSNYFPNAMSPYASSTGTLDYTRSTHSSATKPFDDRYRQSAAASAGIPDFRGLPPSTGSSDMFSGLPSVNSSFNLYASNPMSYHHPQHMSDNVNSAFLTHSTSAQHAMFERDYAAAAAHRGLYSQNAPYPFIDERQYGASSKLTHPHPVAPAAAPQERDLMGRTGGHDSQLQDPYRSVIYRY